MNLKTDQSRYKVFLDDSYAVEKEEGKTAELWRYYELRGLQGIIYPWSESHLAAQLNAFNSPIPGRVKAEHPEWTVIQSGDREITFKIPNKDFEDAAQLARCRKRRVVAPEAAERLAQFRFKSGDSSSAVTEAQ